MKINSIQFTLALLLIILIAGFGAGLMFIVMPPGSKEVVIALTGTLSTALITVINNLLRKPRE